MTNKIYTLKEPIEFNGETITRLEFKPPRGKHIKKMNLQNLNLDELLQVAAKVSGQLPKLFDEMVAEDCIAISNLISDFLLPGQEIGQNTTD